MQHKLQHPIIDQHGQTYEVTPSRLQRWRFDHPEASVEHQKTEADGMVTVRVILRYLIDGQNVEVDGIAEGERIQGDEKTVENVATKALGRALKVAGYPGTVYFCPDSATDSTAAMDQPCPAPTNGKASGEAAGDKKNVFKCDIEGGEYRGDPWGVVVHFAVSKGKTLKEVFDNDKKSWEWLEKWQPGSSGYQVTDQDRHLRAALDAIQGQQVAL